MAGVAPGENTSGPFHVGPYELADWDATRDTEQLAGAILKALGRDICTFYSQAIELQQSLAELTGGVPVKIFEREGFASLRRAEGGGIELICTEECPPAENTSLLHTTVRLHEGEGTVKVVQVIDNVEVGADDEAAPLTLARCQAWHDLMLIALADADLE